MFQMKDIWTGMDDLGILAELEAAEETLKKGLEEEEEDELGM